MQDLGNKNLTKRGLEEKAVKIFQMVHQWKSFELSTVPVCHAIYFRLTTLFNTNLSSTDNSLFQKINRNTGNTKCKWVMRSILFHMVYH